jgi:hypothetical protein
MLPVKLFIKSKYNFYLIGVSFYLFLLGIVPAYASDCNITLFISGIAMILYFLCLYCPGCGESLFEYLSTHPLQGYYFLFKVIIFSDVKCPCCGLKSKGLWSTEDESSQLSTCHKEIKKRRIDKLEKNRLKSIDDKPTCAALGVIPPQSRKIDKNK